MDSETPVAASGVEAQPCGCTCYKHLRWSDPRLKRLFWAVFITGAGIGSVITSLGFGFLYLS